jgi:hypothetical protein
MAIMPGAVWRPLPAGAVSTSRMTAYDITCIHTMVGSLAGTDNYFRTGSANSHFGTGGDGTIYQWVDTSIQSWANLNGNHHIISIENADMGPEFAKWNTNDGNAVPAFTAKQSEAIAKILAWANKTHGIPLDQIQDSKPGRRGTGFHRQGVPGYMVAGGEKWSNATGKVCPGDRRVAQIPQIIARAKQIVAGVTPPAPAPVPETPKDPEMRLIRASDNGQIYTVTDTEVSYEGDPEVYSALLHVYGTPLAVTRRQVDLLSYDANERRANFRREIAAEVKAQLKSAETPAST